MKWFTTVLERLLGLIGALLFSQAPLFMLQYRHQMAGHVAELKRHVESMTQVAQQGGKSLQQFIQKFLTSTDADFRAQGQLMEGMVQRWQQLTEGLTRMQEASFWEQPYVFLKYFDRGVVADTYLTFQLGVPFTVEGACYALLGLLIGMGLFRLGRGLFSFRKEERGGSAAAP